MPPVRHRSDGPWAKGKCLPGRIVDATHSAGSFGSGRGAWVIDKDRGCRAIWRWGVGGPGVLPRPILSRSTTWLMRFRPSFFPFTEPLLRGSISSATGPSGPVVKFGEGTDWMEILGCGYGCIRTFCAPAGSGSPDEYQGFAFGAWGARTASLVLKGYGMPDLRGRLLQRRCPLAQPLRLPSIGTCRRCSGGAERMSSHHGLPAAVA